MQHSFDVRLAKIYGVEEAIVLNNLYFCISENKANNKHFYDGDYWFCNSIEAFTEILPYWTKRQIERILNSLRTQQAVKTGNYNKLAYDRTMWYALSENVKSIYANGETKRLKGE